MTVVEALNNVMADVQSVGKNDKNTHQGFRFRGIDAVVNAVGPALRRHGVIIAPTATIHRAENATTSTGKATNAVTLIVTFTVWGPDGDSIEVQVSGEAMDSGDKATPKAHSVAYRTALLQLLCIPTDEPDPDATTYERSGVPDPDPSIVSKAALLEAVEGDKDRARDVWSATPADERPMTVGEWIELAGMVPA